MYIYIVKTRGLVGTTISEIPNEDDQKIVISDNPKVLYVKRKRTMEIAVLQFETPVNTGRHKTTKEKTIYSRIYMK